MTNELQNFCQDWLNAWTGNEPGKLINYYTDGAFYLDPANKKGLWGHAQLLPYFNKLLQLNPNWIWKPIEIIPTGAGFTLKWEATIPVGSAMVIERGLDIVELRDGKINRNEVYFDRTAWMKAVSENK